MSDGFGMMEGAYFVGRNELLNWLNDLLQLNYTKVEQVASGASHCQVMDAIYPGKVPLHKVNFNAKFEYEYVKNYKVLQDLFTKLSIDRFIDVQKLIKAKYQDNLEFLQWIKRYYDLHSSGGSYNALERRREGKCNYEGDSKSGIAAEPRPTAAKQESSLSSGAARVKAPARSAPTGAAPKASSSALKPVNRDTSKPAPTAAKPADKVIQPAVDNQKIKIIEEEYKNKVSDMNSQIIQLKLSVDNLEKERDFYFNKLREVEILCQNNPACVVEDILKILYATDDENMDANNWQQQQQQ